MEVFVKDMPKNCNVCTFRLKKDWCVCCFLNDSMLATEEKNRPQHCPLNSLDQHDAEVKKQVVEELREWHYKKLLEVRQKDKIQSEDKGSEEEMARLYALFLGRYNILGDLKQKLTELEKTPQGKGEKENV